MVVNHPNRHHIPLGWLKPKTNDSASANTTSASNSILPSFVDLRRKTQQTLYGGDGRDKSPKGSVDAPIQDLVDLINHHSSYTTLSSCSGRISLFDPNHHHHQSRDPSLSTPQKTSTDNDATSASRANTANFGKGTTGGWQFVSHYPVLDPREVMKCLEAQQPTTATNSAAESDDNDNITNATTTPSSISLSSPWLFQMEPMLLHIGASSLRQGQVLLRLALECGYRESGLVVTDSRVTVAIRSHSLALNVPIMPTFIPNPLNPPSLAYVEALVEQANQRLLQTWNQQERLYQVIEKTLFARIPPTVTARISTATATQQVPSLSLWQAATVSIVRRDDIGDEHHISSQNDANVRSIADDDVDVWAFGGYGVGPERYASRSAQRSSNIYKLERRKGHWKSEWEAATWKQQQQETSDTATGGQQEPTKVTSGLPGMLSVVDKLPDCQGMAACRFGGSNWIVLWGGRTSPKRPQGTLYLWDCTNQQLLTPNSVNGEIPSPRWGHSMVSIKLPCSNHTNSSSACLAVTGGCDDSRAFDDIHVLHYINKKAADGSNGHYFYWERLSLRLPTPRFHHSSVVVDQNILCILGGLTSTSNMVGAFAAAQGSPPAEKQAVIWACCLQERQQAGEIWSTTASNVEIGTDDTVGDVPVVFGGAVSRASHLSSSAFPFLITGGIPINNSYQGEVNDAGAAPIGCAMIVLDRHQKKARVVSMPVKFAVGDDSANHRDADNKDKKDLADFGSLVHHSCVQLSPREFLLVGGGVSSFAFGDYFAKSMMVTLEIQGDHLTPLNEPAQVRTGATSKPSTQSAVSATQASDATTKSAMTTVLFVAPENAKIVKTQLEARGWLDKGFRMSKIQSISQIAVPVLPDAWEAISADSDSTSEGATKSNVAEPWRSMILGRGQEEMSFSTARFASRGKR